jgi:HSP20 family molecular chaperone IbpA
MEYLPSSFFQDNHEPVVFFAAGPPTQSFRNEQGPQGQHHRAGLRDSSGHNNLFAFLAKLAFIILCMYALSMAVRILWYLVAIVFSPPVLLLCLFTLVMSGNHGWVFSTHDFNAREFQRYFGNPCRLRRYFAWGPTTATGRSGPARRSRESGDPDHYPTATASGTTRPPASTRVNTEQPTASTDQPPRNNSPSHDFELVSPFHLMMAVAGTGPNSTSTDTEGRNRSSDTRNASDRNPSDRGDNQPEFTKIPIHRHETEQALILSMDISGFDPSQLHITVEKISTLCIRGERTNKIGDRFVLKENFDLNPAEFAVESITANASDGVLQVKVQKKAPSQPRVVSVNVDIEKTD